MFSKFSNFRNLNQILVSLGALTIGAGCFGLAITPQAQAEIEVIETEELIVAQTPAEQTEALNAVAKMAEGQRTFYKKHGKFLNQIDDIQQDFRITLPSEFNYAIRTTGEAAYNYVIPSSDSLKAYVGATFLAIDGSDELTTIICQNEDTGLERPADPQLVRNPLDPTEIDLQCGDYSVEVPASKVTQ